MDILPTIAELRLSRARLVATNLEKRPTLLYDVLCILQDEYEVLGPWEEGFQGTPCRKNPKGETIASIQKDSQEYGWVIVDNRGRTLLSNSTALASLPEAKAQVDAHLREQGVLLA